MTDPEFIAVTITGPNFDGLVSIVRVLVESRLAACGNVIPGITSTYRWQDRVEEESEALAIIHTRASLMGELERAVTGLHPYNVPQIVALPAVTTTTYGDWIDQTTKRTERENA